MDGFTDTQLKLAGWSIEHLRNEIAAGRLKAVQQGTGFFVRQAWLDTWLAIYDPQGTKAPGSRGARQTATVAGDAWTEWSGLVEQLVSNGTPRRVAIAGVDGMRPGLRQAAIAAFNLQQRQREQAETERIRANRERLRHAHA
ncbi:MAG: hypothetical protein GXY83_43130 [Rhodopirellula sp.]|nr:hypothetical protein [Rhodopirellula sp.]